MPDARLHEIAARWAALPEVAAIALGGSHGAGKADADSDIDLYVYSHGEVPVTPRRALVEQRADVTNVNTGYWGPEDGWLERTDGLHVEIVYRRVADIEEHVAARLDRHEPGVGYSTAFLFTLHHSRALHDPEGWLERMQARVARPYPPALTHAIVQHNFPLLRGLISAYPQQIELAVKRRDVVSVNHRLTELLASAFDILFAWNRQYHPGEKRLLTYAGALPLRPPRLTEQVEALLSFTPTTLDAVPAQVRELVDDLATLTGQD